MNRLGAALSATFVLGAVGGLFVFSSAPSVAGGFTGPFGSGGGASLSVVEASGQLARANEDLYANAFVASGITPDGGTAAYAFISNRDAKWKMGAGSLNEIRPVGNDLYFDNSASRFSTIYTTQFACTPATNCLDYSDGWRGTIPGSTPACTGGTEGGLKGNSTSHELIYCDGTTNNTVAFIAEWGAALNFAVFGAAGCQTLTLAAVGAVRNEPLVLGGCGDVTDADGDLACGGSVTDTDVVSVRLCCIDSAGCADPPPITFTAVVLR